MVTAPSAGCHISPAPQRPHNAGMTTIVHKVAKVSQFSTFRSWRAWHVRLRIIVFRLATGTLDRVGLWVIVFLSLSSFLRPFFHLRKHLQHCDGLCYRIAFAHASDVSFSFVLLRIQSGVFRGAVLVFSELDTEHFACLEVGGSLFLVLDKRENLHIARTVRAPQAERHDVVNHMIDTEID